MFFSKEVTITICADTWALREGWAKKFQDFFEAATVTYGVGVWEGVLEPHVRVSHLYQLNGEDEPDWIAFENLVSDYKVDADQTAALVVFRDVRGHLY